MNILLNFFSVPQKKKSRMIWKDKSEEKKKKCTNCSLKYFLYSVTAAHFGAGKK